MPARYAKIYLGLTPERCLERDHVPDLIVYPNGTAIEPIEETREENPVFEILCSIDSIDPTLEQNPDYCDRHAVVLCFGYRPRRIIEAIESRDWPVTVIDALRL